MTKWQWPTDCHTLIRANFDLGSFDFRGGDGCVETFIDDHEAMTTCSIPCRAKGVREVFKLTLKAASEHDLAGGIHAWISAAECVGYQPALALPADCRS